MFQFMRTMQEHLFVLAETIPPQYTPRSKHYHTKTIWFREEIQKRSIKLLKIATQEQLGDMFTTSSRTRSFEARGAQSKLARTGSPLISSRISAREALAAQRRTRTSELCSPLCRSPRDSLYRRCKIRGNWFVEC
ncbi:hypothetical protein THAOC_21961 [Thalassiosira oceanica]|uniref:Uncharacterized protein n=1 Tax=Thalassiosira oceanica TaxID=159749 RepID=K0RVW1_THAOC|nr:hypothetical protein THAOC_21961 [Thalassiosira oceanica]|eukprot:EJK57953.1 hypothetical protein THAOC_21961 [Thalassiosira oceanica]